MNILMLTNEYPNEKHPKPDWTWVVPYFCRSWVKQGHRVIAINNAAAFPKAYYLLAKILSKAIAAHYDVSDKGLDELAWTKSFSFVDEGVEVYNLPMRKYKPGGKYKEVQLDKQAEKIKSLLIKMKFIPDVITGHWVNPQLFLVKRLKNEYKKAKSGFVFHGDYSEKIYKVFNVQEEIDDIDCIGFRNRSALESAQKYMKFDRMTFVCASGIPDSFINVSIKEKTFDDKALRILSAGRLVEYKHFPESISACANTFKGINYKYTIAGDGPLREKIKKQIISLKLEDSIVLLGQVPRIKIQEMMKDSDIFILISKKETFGLVYLEAMLQGCIVIASRSGGVDGIIQHGINGFLCEEGNEIELSTLLKKIIAMTNEEKKRVSSNAVQTAKNYTESLVAQRYLNALMGI